MRSDISSVCLSLAGGTAVLTPWWPWILHVSFPALDSLGLKDRLLGLLALLCLSQPPVDVMWVWVWVWVWVCLLTVSDHLSSLLSALPRSRLCTKRSTWATCSPSVAPRPTSTTSQVRFVIVCIVIILPLSSKSCVLCESVSCRVP